ncbi:polysialyltransferase family glycosyltransferase [Streptomyces sp. GESEQ-4]|uniref:polysialyltransferase family glycosyltransferase n=1 Tax=Streptomyces sp. GESEQ-4 TaxID=2812655 RepID=UPI001B338629|nr:polysialyltransferase family glycosyltransferase [Streptomyces sp. GESEQ-4]
MPLNVPVPTEPRDPVPVQLVEASTLYGLATVCAAVAQGLLPLAEGGRRVLVTSTNTTVPEAQPPWEELPGFAHLSTYFDAVVSWNDTIFPNHPSVWSPRPEDRPLFEQALRRSWGIGPDAPVELVAESVQSPPSLTLARLFADATLHVYADGLMSYGPLRTRLEQQVLRRVGRFVYPELVPGLRPHLLDEWPGAEHHPLSPDALRRTLTVLADAAKDELEAVRELPQGSALLLGQYLAEAGILSAAEEDALHRDILREAVRGGAASVLFKPHPSAPRRHAEALRGEAARAGVTLHVVDLPVLAEVLYERLRPDVVLGCFSTALFTATTVYGIPAVRVGTDLVLRRLKPYENSNRIPLVIADCVLPGPGAVEARDEVRRLVATVSFCMQPIAYAHLRPTAEQLLSAARAKAVAGRYLGLLRLTRLRLPGGLPAPRLLLPLAKTSFIHRHRSTLARLARTARGTAIR